MSCKYDQCYYLPASAELVGLRKELLPSIVILPISRLLHCDLASPSCPEGTVVAWSAHEQVRMEEAQKSCLVADSCLFPHRNYIQFLSLLPPE